MEREVNCENQVGLKCTIIGSFRFMDKINQAIDTLENLGVTILAPKKGRVSTIKDGFKILDCDHPLADPVDIEGGFLNGLLRSDFAYLVNPGGYLGRHSVAEIGIAQALKIPLLAMENIDPKLDESSLQWGEFCGSVDVCPVNQLGQIFWRVVISKKRNMPFSVDYLYDLSRLVINCGGLEKMKLGELLVKSSRLRNLC